MILFVFRVNIAVKSDYYPYSIDHLIFVVETRSVFFEVTKFLNIIKGSYFKFSQVNVMYLVATHRPIPFPFFGFKP